MDGELRAREEDTQKYTFYLYSLSLLLSASVVACSNHSEDFRGKLSGLVAQSVVVQDITTLSTLSPSICLLNSTFVLYPQIVVNRPVFVLKTLDRSSNL